MTAADDASTRVRVVVVDDSALMRKLLTDLLNSSPRIEVVGAAADADAALELTGTLRPDVVTLDVQMPGQSGIDVLPTMISKYAVPVIMISSLTREGADVTLTALELGAVDFFPKPDRHQISEMKACRDVLVEKVLNAAKSRVRRSHPTRPDSRPATVTKPHPPDHSATHNVERPSHRGCIVIGISTGGPETLGRLLPMVAPPIPPILIVQHMPAAFTGVFAERLNRICQVPVKEAESGDVVVSNQILIAPGGRHMTVIGRPSRATVHLSDGPTVSGHRPSVDMLFLSAAKIFESATIGVLMTGMGRDGVEGCRRILADGGQTFGQDEATSVVYGMNKAAFLEAAIGSRFAADDLPGLILQLSRNLN